MAELRRGRAPKSFIPLNWQIDDAMRKLVLARIANRLAFVERDLVGPYLTGDVFTAADAYFFVIGSWTRFYGIPLDSFPRIAVLLASVGNRPSVRAALAAEGHGMVDVPDPAPQP
jgi:glutathione S-transferase